MASATGIPNENPAVAAHSEAENEPLLGAPGDATQKEERGLQFNLVLGTAVVAQIGIWILAAVVWISVFTHPLILFSAHPLLNSAGILVVVEGILILQPTYTQRQKILGANVHSIWNGVAILALIAGLIVIEYNKISHAGTHFESPHAILGLITYIFFVVQVLVGFSAYFIPTTVFGSVNKGKSLYKYHRISGYTILVLALATVAASTQTDYNKNVLHIQLWAILVPAVILLVGVVPRIKKQKLGF